MKQEFKIKTTSKVFTDEQLCYILTLESKLTEKKKEYLAGLVYMLEELYTKKFNKGDWFEFQKRIDLLQLDTKSWVEEDSNSKRLDDLFVKLNQMIFGYKDEDYEIYDDDFNKSRDVLFVDDEECSLLYYSTFSYSVLSPLTFIEKQNMLFEIMDAADDSRRLFLDETVGIRSKSEIYEITKSKFGSGKINSKFELTKSIKKLAYKDSLTAFYIRDICEEFLEMLANDLSKDIDSIVSVWADINYVVQEKQLTIEEIDEIDPGYQLHHDYTKCDDFTNDLLRAWLNEAFLEEEEEECVNSLPLYVRLQLKSLDID